MKKAFFILLYIYVSAVALTAQEVSVSARFDTSRIFIGDQVNYSVTIDRPVSYLLTVPLFRDTLFSKIEILRGPESDTVSLMDGRLRITQKYLVTAFDSGFYRVPPVYAEFKNQGGIKRYYSDYSPLEVMRVQIAPPDTAQKIFDIIGPYRAPLTAGEILPWLLTAAVLAALAWYLVRLIRKLKMKRSGEIPAPLPDPAHVIALRMLEQLKAEKLWEQGLTKHYYTRLTEILRQYLDNRFSICSLELTSQETLAELKKSGFRDEASYNILREVLTEADLVKFAKYAPLPDENERNFSLSREFVEHTKQETA
jgi:hypothetical protein